MPGSLGSAVLRTVLEAAPDAVLVVSRGGRIVFANDRVTDTFGYAPDELVGQDLDALLPEGMRGAHSRWVERYFESPQTRPMGTMSQLTGRRRDGTEVPLDIKLAPVSGAERDLVVAVVRDVSHIRESERQIRAYAERLEASNRQLEAMVEERNRFLGIAAHDLRNPLVAVLGYADLLAEELAGPVNEQQRRTLATITRSAEFMSALVGDLLDVAALDAGKLTLRRAPRDVGALVRDACRLLRPAATRKGVALKVTVGDGSVTAEVDAVKLEQVVHNLVSNAVRFSPAGAKIAVSVVAVEGDVVLAVADQGPGIPADELDRIFEPFVRVRSAHEEHPEERTTGLGLAIVKRIVDGHGGHITVESVLGAGATFAVTLPVAAVPVGDGVAAAPVH